jgi:hypothetical protein
MDLVRLTKKMLSSESYKRKQRRLAACIFDKMEDPIAKMVSYLNANT